VKARLIALTLFAAGAIFAQVSVGIRIGAPPPVRVMRVQPRSPGEGYSWIGGYWYPASGHYKWHQGYWTRPAYGGAHWVEPRYDGGRFYQGYWDGGHGRVDHRHGSDRSRNRDFKRDRHDQ
jgi:hypothetical protein